MIEHRKFIRLRAPIGITYKIAKKGRRPRPNPSFVRDIGGGGVSFQVKEDLRPGDLLEIQIQIPHLAEPVEAIAEVVWFTHHAERNVREAGIRFRDIAAADLHHVLEYVHHIGIGA